MRAVPQVGDPVAAAFDLTENNWLNITEVLDYDPVSDMWLCMIQGLDMAEAIKWEGFTYHDPAPSEADDDLPFSQRQPHWQAQCLGYGELTKDNWR